MFSSSSHSPSHKLTAQRWPTGLHVFTLAVALLLLVLNLVSSSYAQTAGVPPTPAELEKFRRDYLQMLREMDDLNTALQENEFSRDILGKGKVPKGPSFTEAEQLVLQMTPQDLALIYDAFEKQFPDWRNASKTLGKLVDNLEKVKRVPRSSLDRESRSAITPDNCQDAITAAPSWTDWAATAGAEIAAQAVYEAIPEPFNAAALVPWAAISAGRLTAETLNNIFDRCSGDQAIDDLASSISTIQSSITDVKTAVTNAQTNIINNNNANTTTLGTAIGNAQTNIINNDNSNKTAIITNNNTNTNTVTSAISTAQTNINNNSNANTTTITTAITNSQTTIINNANANKNELRDLLLRTQIEADLAQTEGSTPVALYMLPTSQGGYLDLVDTIVADIIAKIKAAGGSVGQADSLLAEARTAKNSGQFKLAYTKYRKAYKAAAN